MIAVACLARIASRLAQRWYHHSSFWLTFLIPIAVIVTSCGKQADSGRPEPSPVQTSDSDPNPTPRATATPATDVTTTLTPKVSVMIITYQTQSTPNQYASPPGMRIAATRGEEIRYLDLANNRMRLEKSVFGNSGKKLYQTMIINQTGSYRFEPGKNEAFFTKMSAPVPVWNFDQNVNTTWARERGLTVKPGQWLNRTCDVVSVGSGNNVWLWNEIPLKKEQKLVGSDIVISAYRIQENSSVEAAMLQVPAEMKIIGN